MCMVRKKKYTRRSNDINSLYLRGDRKIPIRLGQKLYQAAVSGGNKNVQFFEFDDSFEHR